MTVYEPSFRRAITKLEFFSYVTSRSKSKYRYGSFNLRRVSQTHVRILLHSIMRRELWARFSPVMGKRMPYWRAARLRALSIYKNRFASSAHFLPPAPIYESKRLPTWNDTMETVRHVNVNLGAMKSSHSVAVPEVPAGNQVI